MFVVRPPTATRKPKMAPEVPKFSVTSDPEISDEDDDEFLEKMFANEPCKPTAVEVQTTDQKPKIEEMATTTDRWAVPMEPVKDRLQKSAWVESPSLPAAKDSEIFDNKPATYRIDMVLTFTKTSNGSNERVHHQYRQNFERHLKSRGLDCERSQCGTLVFVKIRASAEFLCGTAERLQLPVPIAPSDIPRTQSRIRRGTKKLKSKVAPKSAKTSTRCSSELDCPEMFYMPFSHSNLSRVIKTPGYGIFTPTQRIYLVDHDIQRTVIPRVTEPGKRKTPHLQEEEKEEELITFQWLLDNGIYSAYYPQHESKSKPKSDRYQLLKHWGSFAKWHDRQPLDRIRGYFGEQLGFYFAWLGHYTRGLVFMAVFSILCFVYGLERSAYSRETIDLCESNKTVCRPCRSPVCAYKNLSSACYLSMMSHTFDNAATFGFAIFASVWSVLLFESWKRKQNTLGFDWRVSTSKTSQVIRPSFWHNVKTTKVNPITRNSEPYLDFRDRCRRKMLSCIIACTFITGLVGFLVAMVIYRASMQIIFARIDDKTVQEVGPSLFASITASGINLVVITVMSFIYPKVALKLTEFECPRAQEAFESSYTYKVVFFQLVNYYGALLYLTFVKGKMSHAPHLQESAEGVCPPSGCLTDVTIQLFTIMTVKQFVQNLFEISLPTLKVLYRKFKIRNHEVHPNEKCYLKDHRLNPISTPVAFDDFLEMTIQYGFLVMFSPAFPLAAFFALLNNLAEIRLDARKYLLDYRRPVPKIVKGIGPWMNILEALTRIGVVINAFIIAFTSEFIDQIYFRMTRPTENYADFAFSKFRTQDYNLYFNDTDYVESLRWSKSMQKKVVECHYRGYFYPPGSPNQYQPTSTFYSLLLARLAFVVVFEHLVFFLQTVIERAIPDVPNSVELKRLREEFLVKEISDDKERLRKSKIYQRNGNGNTPKGLKLAKTLANKAGIMNLSASSLFESPRLTDVSLVDEVQNSSTRNRFKSIATGREGFSDPPNDSLASTTDGCKDCPDNKAYAPSISSRPTVVGSAANNRRKKVRRRKQNRNQRGPAMVRFLKAVNTFC